MKLASDRLRPKGVVKNVKSAGVSYTRACWGRDIGIGRLGYVSGNGIPPIQGWGVCKLENEQQFGHYAFSARMSLSKA